MDKIYRILISCILLVIITGCTGARVAQQIEEMTEKQMQEKAMEEKEMIEGMIEAMEPVAENWRDIELTDVEGNKFKISDFNKPVLLESFAVWCPTCRKQQEKIKELHEEIGDTVISISLDTDPNEDEEQVIEHQNRYGFDWVFVVSPVSVTKSLIDEFGISVVNAPSAPVVLICEDLSARLLERGVKSADELKEEIGEC
jgi:thiol-disulfide isomerase/thioredoxin